MPKVMQRIQPTKMSFQKLQKTSTQKAVSTQISHNPLTSPW